MSDLFKMEYNWYGDELTVSVNEYSMLSSGENLDNLARVLGVKRYDDETDDELRKRCLDRVFSTVDESSTKRF